MSQTSKGDTWPITVHASNNHQISKPPRQHMAAPCETLSFSYMFSGDRTDRERDQRWEEEEEKKIGEKWRIPTK